MRSEVAISPFLLQELETPFASAWLLREFPDAAALSACSLLSAGAQLDWPSEKAVLAEEIPLPSLSVLA